MKLVSATLSILLLSATSLVHGLPQRDNSVINGGTAELQSSLGYDSSLFEMAEAIKGIIFGDFEAQPDTQRFNGSLAIQGNCTATDYFVNLNHTTITCSNNSTLNLTDYGLIVGGQLNVQSTSVNGAVYAATNNNMMNSTQQGITFTDGCSNISTTTIANLFNFTAMNKAAFNISQYFASQNPNMVIRDGGFLSDGQFLGSRNQEYYIYTFDKCQEHACVIPDYLYSSPEQIFFGGNWTGPWNTVYPKDKTIIFNIPVLTDSIFNMSTRNPAAGLENAEIVYNVYPVKSTGAYDPTGHIVWFRNTTESISGHFLAPSAFVIENNKGGFNGQLVASRYLSVQNLDDAMFLNGSATDIMNNVTAAVMA